MTTRIDIIGQNGGDGSHYLVEKIARAICGEEQDFKMVGNKRRWEQFVPNAIRVLGAIKDE